MTAALEGGEWSAERPGRTLPPGKTQYPFYRRLGGSQGRTGRAEILVPPGFDPGPSSPQSVAIPTELPGPHSMTVRAVETKDVRLKDRAGCITCVLVSGCLQNASHVLSQAKPWRSVTCMCSVSTRTRNAHRSESI